MKDGSRARWQEARSEKALCLQTYYQKCHGYNWKTSIAINGDKSLVPAIKKGQEVKGKTLQRMETLLQLSPSLPPLLLPFLTLRPFSFPSASLLAHCCQFLFTQQKENYWFVQEHLRWSQRQNEDRTTCFPLPFPSCGHCVCWISNSKSVNECLAKLHILKAINHMYPP